MSDVQAVSPEASVPSGRAGTARQKLGYQPALDGIRGVGLIAVVVFHAGITWFPGSFLAVSVFFTLSGFLITRLLFEERRDHGGIALGGFYARRIRRLLPASSLTLLAVVGLGAVGVFDDVADLRRELVGAALQVSNWVRLTSDQSYVDLFEDGVSPVEHFWSLAIEEQFYLLWPLVLGVAARRSLATARRVVVGLFAAVVVLAPVVSIVWGPEATYLATPARVGEILAGAVLALHFDWRRPPAWLRLGSVAAGLAILVLIVVTPFDHGWAYQGGLPLFGVLSAVLVAGALVDGPVRTVLSWRGFVALGTISYGVYLVHWPVYVVADRHGQGLGSAGLLAVKFGVTFAIAIAVYVGIEQPIRRGPLRRGTAATWVAALAVVGVLAFTVIPGPEPIVAPADAADVAAVDLQPVAGPLPPLVDGSGRQARPARLLLVGDSTGAILGNGFVSWARDRPEDARVRNATVLGCGLVLGGRSDELVDLNRDDCDRAVGRDVPESFATLRPDVVAISVSGADVFPRRWDDGPLLLATDDEYARRIRDDYGTFFAAAAAAGVPHVVWLRPPIYGDPPDASFVDGGQALIEQVVRDQATRFPGMVTIVDYRAWFEAEGLDEQPVRPDGVHLQQDVADRVVRDFLGPQLLAAAEVP